MAASSTKIFLGLLLIAVLALSAVPAIAAYGCLADCIGRCSNGQNLAECTKMCTQACVPVGGGLADEILN
ncbi:hypothetical protein Taro_054176 [Colocasia esculenta]|uniref:Uncharacterized protein n=1 Tax=Colocasia esculenta TaxID=4460 RepID=A0A843XN11_COLES|nr:hypothetical protein [Colocasia esculenta]